jgi:hypothetical protein
MNDQVALHKRKLVAITDPHIKVAENYFVYDDGVALETDSSDSV